MFTGAFWNKGALEVWVPRFKTVNSAVRALLTCFARQGTPNFPTGMAKPWLTLEGEQQFNC